MSSINKQVQIGPCTLILGDCLEVMPTIGVVGHVITDPPYEKIMHDSKNKPKNRKLRRDGGAELKGLDFAPIDEIRREFTEIVSEICEGWLIAFCTSEGVRPWADVINSSSAKYKRACLWVKPDSTPQLNGQGPASGHEQFITAWCGSGFSKWNGGGKRGVYTHLTNPKTRDRRHPTEKPISLMSELITDFTQPDETILDPFMGSGSTLVAGMKLGRQVVGIEKDEKWFDVAVDRVSKAYNQMDLFNDVLAATKSKQQKLELIGGGA